MRDYFAAVSGGAPPLALTTSAGAPSASSEGSAGSNAGQEDVRRQGAQEAEDKRPQRP